MMKNSRSTILIIGDNINDHIDKYRIIETKLVSIGHWVYYLTCDPEKISDCEAIILSKTDISAICYIEYLTSENLKSWADFFCEKHGFEILKIKKQL